jgi:hypothetical protein
MFEGAGARVLELDDDVVEDEPAALAIAPPPMSAAATAAAVTSEDLMFLMSLLSGWVRGRARAWPRVVRETRELCENRVGPAPGSTRRRVIRVPYTVHALVLQQP